MVATALTVYGIETSLMSLRTKIYFIRVATALTVYGIETGAGVPVNMTIRCNSSYRLRY